jgi:D-tyrosyl-tRNA(Tyr) deacylase
VGFDITKWNEKTVIALLQRTLFGRVVVEGETVAEIGPGVLVLLAVEPTDTPADADDCIARVLRYRMFADAEGRMNCSLLDTGGALLLVPQFTLAADTRRGLRPGFSTAAPPELGESLFNRAVSAARAQLGDERVASGRFGAHMRVSLTNDGPVTFWLQVPPPAAR